MMHDESFTSEELQVWVTSRISSKMLICTVHFFNRRLNVVTCQTRKVWNACSGRLYESQMLCCTMHCQWGRKPPKLPLTLGISSPC